MIATPTQLAAGIAALHRATEFQSVKRNPGNAVAAIWRAMWDAMPAPVLVAAECPGGPL